MSKEGRRTTALASAIAVAVIGLAVTTCNMSNESVDGGYVGYVHTAPLFDQKEFVGTITGPGGTGYVWRQKLVPISVTPYTKYEEFTDILAADNLKMTADAQIVFRIDSKKVKEFVEQYAAIAEVEHEPEAIIQDAYQSFIQQKFKTSVRTAVAKHKGLDAPMKLKEIADAVATELQEHFQDSPFVIEAVTIGRTTPPALILDEVERKVEATQRDLRKSIELDIAKKEEDIKESEGIAARNLAEQKAQAEKFRVEQEALANLARQEADAKGQFALMEAQARGKMLEAEAIKKMNAAIGDNLIELERAKNIPNMKVPHIYVGGSIFEDILEKFTNVMR